MTDKTTETPADLLFEEGMKYDLRQDKSLAAATFARAAFQQAASMGHTRAIRALAHMVFEGNGGGQDREHALLLLWSAFLRGDHESLGEFADMLETYGESPNIPFPSKVVSDAARQAEEIVDRLARLRYFVDELVRNKANKEFSKPGA